MYTSSVLRGGLSLIGLAALLLLPLSSLAQPDDKDAEIARLKKENAQLREELREREMAIVRLQAEIKRFRIGPSTFDSVRPRGPLSNEQLIEIIRDLIDKNRTDGRKKAQPAQITDEKPWNPPLVGVDGKIEKLDGNLMQINVGTDQGVNKDNTLDVYRLLPEAKYLGTIRIVVANTHKSVGRLINGDATKLRVGDLVTSKSKEKEEPKKK